MKLATRLVAAALLSALPMAAHADYPDARAAAAATHTIDKLILHSGLDTQPLLEEAAVLEQALKDINKKTGESEEAAKKRSIMYG